MVSTCMRAEEGESAWATGPQESTWMRRERARLRCVCARLHVSARPCARGKRVLLRELGSGGSVSVCVRVLWSCAMTNPAWLWGRDCVWTAPYIESAGGVSRSTEAARCELGSVCAGTGGEQFGALCGVRGAATCEAACDDGYA